MPMRECHLMRVTYRTDVTPADPDYVGSFSSTVMVDDDAQIVNVDWSKRGQVEVTFLMPGAKVLT